MTEKQDKLYWRLWGAACRRQGWNKAGGFTAKMADAKRKEIHTKVFGSPISSTVLTNDQVDKVFAEFRTLADNVQGARESDHPEIGERRRLLDVIADHFKCARVYDPTDAYLKKVLAPRFKIVDGWHTIEDLSPEPTLRKNWKTGKLEEGPSELMQCVYTLARCVNDLRNKAGDTIHEMKIKAGLVCGCASICQKRQMAQLAVQTFPEILTAGTVTRPVAVSEAAEVEDDENVPF